MNAHPGIAYYPALKKTEAGEREKINNEPIIEEVPVTIFLNGQEITTLLALKGEEEFLAAGFLASAGIISKASEISGLKTDTGVVQVTVKNPGAKIPLNYYLSLAKEQAKLTPGDTGRQDKIPSLTLTTNEIETYAQILEEKSKLYQVTGGAHGGCLAQAGEMKFFSFDVSRLNVFDKLYGRCLLQGIERENKVMVFSGRVSAEIVLKLYKMGLSVIIARSAPTSLALDLAVKFGITIIAFARGARFNVYTHEERVLF
ncbi:MAG: formate dehydrogenase accessory sulfurtransferase FdhD [Sporomusaceae bacterium]|jgi:FdhD protein|nr:formate dehydrogenase accessory sulfurtransferase FdhD [Sporomusaceae bacterium]